MRREEKGKKEVSLNRVQGKGEQAALKRNRQGREVEMGYRRPEMLRKLKGEKDRRKGQGGETEQRGKGQEEEEEGSR